MFKKYVSIVFVLAGVASAQAGEIYAGVGFPGISLGYAQSVAPNLGLRGEYTGGLSMSKSGLRNGVNFNGNLKAQSVSALVDYFPMNSSFRLTGGVNFNDTKFTLNSTGGSAMIDNKPVNLVGQFFNVEIKQPGVTPYLGIGYGFKPDSKTGFGFYADAGVMVGKFTSATSTSLVTSGQNITQANVDAQTASIRDSVSKLSVLPKVSVGVSYRF